MTAMPTVVTELIHIEHMELVQKLSIVVSPATRVTTGNLSTSDFWLGFIKKTTFCAVVKSTLSKRYY